MKQTMTAMLRMCVTICFDSKPHTCKLNHYTAEGTRLHSLAKVPVGDLLIGTQPNPVQGFALSFCEINHVRTTLRQHQEVQ
jgi:hypothetical protein